MQESEDRAPKLSVDTQEFVDEQRKFYESNIAGTGFVVKDGRLRASDLRQQKWREEKRELIALDLQTNHSSEIPITDKGNYA
jgi:hypothetical protein